MSTSNWTLPDLPYNRKLVTFLAEEHARGRALYLATGADARLAGRLAEHLGVFTGVLGSDGAINLIGNRKLDAVRDRLGAGEFDYVGNDTPDLPLLERAAEPLVANPSLRLRRKLKARGIRPARTFEERNGPFRSLVKAMRPYQWSKNLLIFLPFLLAHVLSAGRLLMALLAFRRFCLAASATYIVNDLLDIEADRRHAQEAAAAFCLGRSVGPYRALRGRLCSCCWRWPERAGRRLRSWAGCCCIWRARWRIRFI